MKLEETHTLFMSALRRWHGSYRLTLVPSSAPLGSPRMLPGVAGALDAPAGTSGDICINSVFFPAPLCSDHNAQNGETCFCV